jgi:hypothetical protein
VRGADLEAKGESMYGMDQFDQADLPRPTRWDFGSG